MVKSIIQVGDSSGIILGSALLKRVGLKVGDPVEVTLRADGSIDIVPVRPIDKETARKKA